MNGNGGRESQSRDVVDSSESEAGAGSVNEFAKGVVRPQAIGSSKEDWIGSQLKRVYGDVVEEGIPDDMMALLGQLDAEDGNVPDGDKS